MSSTYSTMTDDERIDLDELFRAEQDARRAVKQVVQQRASAAIEALPPAERLLTLSDLQDRLIDCTPEDQIGELAAWLERIAQR